MKAFNSVLNTERHCEVGFAVFLVLILTVQAGAVVGGELLLLLFCDIIRQKSQKSPTPDLWTAGVKKS